MMRIPNVVSVAVMALMMSGCSTISLNQRMMVKVRTGDPEGMKAPSDGWYFRHIAQAPLKRDEPDAYGDWYVAYQMAPDGKTELEEKHSLTLLQLFGWRWKRVHELTPVIAAAATKTFGSVPLLIEPCFVFYSTPRASNTPPGVQVMPKPGDDTETPAKDVTVAQEPSAVWPRPAMVNGGYDPIWWKRDGYTQLEAAREEVERKLGRHSYTRIGFLDTGFDDRHVAAPSGLEDLEEGDADGWSHGKPIQDLYAPGWNPQETHAMGTIGLLAGNRVRFVAGTDAHHHLVRLARQDGPVYLGGAPHSAVVSVRLAPTPISLSTAAMAYGIDYASRINGCDVITLSHGGAPSLAWTDAVNAAYERGTAIFAAESDWYRWPLPLEIFGTGFATPLPGPYYPAAYRRVIGVTGVTANQTNYAVNPFWNMLAHPSQILTWALRGSYGPDGWSGAAWSPVLHEDPRETGHGKFRAWPIAAYGPNTIWLSGTNTAAYDGAGTSAATPQVSAAAALWLDYNHDKIGGNWKRWQKAEAVYQALLGTTDRAGAAKPDRYLGAGILKARDALKVDYPAIVARGGMSRPMEADDYDARKSFRWLLFGKHLHGEEMARHRDHVFAVLDQDDTPRDGATPLERMYYNTLLLEKWHRGVLPSNEQGEELRRKARVLAGRQVGG
jgi:hypothetical protein